MKFSGSCWPLHSFVSVRPFSSLLRRPCLVTLTAPYWQRKDLQRPAVICVAPRGERHLLDSTPNRLHAADRNTEFNKNVILRVNVEITASTAKHCPIPRGTSCHSTASSNPLCPHSAKVALPDKHGLQAGHVVFPKAEHAPVRGFAPCSIHAPTRQC